MQLEPKPIHASQLIKLARCCWRQASIVLMRAASQHRGCSATETVTADQCSLLASSAARLCASSSSSWWTTDRRGHVLKRRLNRAGYRGRLQTDRPSSKISIRAPVKRSPVDVQRTKLLPAIAMCCCQQSAHSLPSSDGTTAQCGCAICLLYAAIGFPLQFPSDALDGIIVYALT